MVMKNLLFLAPVVVKVDGTVQEVGSVADAFRFLRRWPTGRRGPVFGCAFNSCSAAFSGQLSAEQARQAFASFARISGILIRSGETVIPIEWHQAGNRMLIVRTHKAFWTSRPSPLLAWLTLGVGVIAIIIPYVPIAEWFGFVPLPLPVLVGLVAITVLYLFASEATKRWFFRQESRRSHRKRAGQGIDRGSMPHLA